MTTRNIIRFSDHKKLCLFYFLFHPILHDQTKYRSLFLSNCGGGFSFSNGGGGHDGEAEMGSEGVVGISDRVDNGRCNRNGNLDRLTFDLRDLLDSRGTVNLFDYVTSFNRYFDVFGDGDIDAMFGGDLLASVFDGGDSRLNHRGGHRSNMCGIGVYATQKNLGIGLSLTFLQQNSGTEGSSRGGAMFGGHVLTSLFISDFLIDDGFGFAHGFGSRGATLYFDFFDGLFTVG